MALPTFAQTDAYWDAEMQRREAAEDRAVAQFKMDRDIAAITAPKPAGRPASEGSVSYMRDLMIEKAQVKGMDMGAAIESIDRYIAKGRTQAEVSANIDRLKAEGFTGRTKPATGAEVDVPAGRYAIDTQEGAINKVAFYKVDRPETGKWAGRVFVNRMVGGNPDIAVKGQAAKTILAAIAADPRAASIRYGIESENCGVCGTHLTNDVSREAGIGPDCRKKLGW